MELVKRMVSLGHAARNAAEIRVRQPLAEVNFAVPSHEDGETLLEMADTIADELNVRRVNVLDPTESAAMVHYALKPLDTLGRELRQDFPAVRNALVNGDSAQVIAWSRALLDGRSIEVQVNGKHFTLSPQQVIVKQTSAEGFAVAEEHGYLAALRTELTDDLIREGQAREIVRFIQVMRKDADFDLSDRIAVTFQAEGRLAEVMWAFEAYIRAETLAEEWRAGTPGNGDHTATLELDGETVLLGVRRLKTLYLPRVLG
jgi:isoleucyl-tRNA synthetase